MNYINVAWSAVTFDPPNSRLTGDHNTLVPQWMTNSGTAEEIVQRVCELFFEPNIWVQEFGIKEVHTMIRVRVFEPEYAAGEYVVSLDLVVEACARRMLVKTESSTTGTQNDRNPQI